MEQTTAPDNTKTWVNSNGVRLTGRQWVIAGLLVLALLALAPTAWKQVETFDPGIDYRIPYTLGSDYWLYARHAERVNSQERIPLVGDSVIWGHYVPPDQTLSHHLNTLAGQARFANLGLDGTHPAALAGLVEHYAGGLAGRAIVLHFNPLWITSAKHDLQTTKEFHFNHPKLVSQFMTQIPCYRASLSDRLWAVTERQIPFFSWTSHLQIAYFGGTDLQRWTLEHPYANPGAALTAGLPEPKAAAPEEGSSWLDRSAKQHGVAWVALDDSLQWRFFQQTVERLKARGCRVFVLVGPFNEHMLDEPSRAAYAEIKSQVETWLTQADVPHLIPRRCPPLSTPTPVTPLLKATPFGPNNYWTAPLSGHSPSSSQQAQSLATDNSDSCRSA